ncbi:hypothetical protein [Sphingobacterium allocomposti]|uniref:hypothetical protein n=1 Tax=Sphingobacterium allocomposti TaxID=415956 RepID=UPI0011E72E5C|nr:hypothetical protein [Sphingobacterium composti Yoo et al. 2007 non Ten et al. 2007]
MKSIFDIANSIKPTTSYKKDPNLISVGIFFSEVSIFSLPERVRHTATVSRPDISVNDGLPLLNVSRWGYASIFA